MSQLREVDAKRGIIRNASQEKEALKAKRLPTLKQPRSLKRLPTRRFASIKDHSAKPVNSQMKKEKLDRDAATSATTPSYVLIHKQSEMFKNFTFLNQDFSIGPYKVIKMIKPELYNVEVGLSTSYGTNFPQSVLKQYTSSQYSENPPSNTYMLKSYARNNLISAIVGWDPQDKLIAMTFKCCHPLHCVVFDLVEAAVAIESVSSTLFPQLAKEFNDALKAEVI